MAAESRLQQVFPALALRRGYRRADFQSDLIAGVVVTALLIPHGMAFAEIAGVPAVNGLYTTIFALLAYAAFGPSRLLLLGPDSSLAPLVAATIVLVGADGDPDRAVATAGLLALFTGVICLVGGASRLGVLAELLSAPVRVGYLNGLVIVVIIGQLPALFGFSVESDSTVGVALDFIEGLRDGNVNAAAMGIGLVGVIMIVALRTRWPRVPGVLLAVVGAILAVILFDLTERDVEVIGTIPAGVPLPSWPGVDVGDLPVLFVSALGIAFITLTDTMALSRGFAGRSGESVDSNREVAALGAANIATGLFAGFPVSASTTRSTLAHDSGGKTQLVGVVGAVLVGVVLTFGGTAIENLPFAILAAVVIVAVVGLFDATMLRWLWQARRSEMVLSLVATVGVVVVGVLEGIAVAIALSVIAFLRKAWRPHSAVLGRVTNRKGYHDIERHPEAAQVPGLLIYRFDAPLFFANAAYFAQEIEAGIAHAPTEVQRVVVAAEPITDIDSTAAEMLNGLLDRLDEQGITLVFAELKGPAKDQLLAFGLGSRVGEHNLNSTVGTALDVYLAESGVEWIDWTDATRRPTAGDE